MVLSILILASYESLTILFSLIQVECKKAQPKEVMMPAALTRPRSNGRSAYGKWLGDAKRDREKEYIFTSCQSITSSTRKTAPHYDSTLTSVRYETNNS